MTSQDVGFSGPVPPSLDEVLDAQHLFFKDTFPGAIGVKILEASPDKAVGTMEVGTAVRHPGGYAHGGALAGFADTVAAWATFPNLRPGEIFTTIEFKINFITGITDGVVRAEAVVVHKGSRTIILEVRITTDDDRRKLVAIMIVTQAVLAPGKSARD
jgi:uncharacterized protein (TIGR00369 family)